MNNEKDLHCFPVTESSSRPSSEQQRPKILQCPPRRPNLEPSLPTQNTKKSHLPKTYPPKIPPRPRVPIGALVHDFDSDRTPPPTQTNEPTVFITFSR